MYNWRKMNGEQQCDVLRTRKTQKHPWHSPLHIQGEKTMFHITAACYEHRDIIGLNHERMEQFENEFLKTLDYEGNQIFAHVILQNHYHVLLKSSDVLKSLKKLFQLHQKTGYMWNKEDGKKGRRVWCNALEHGIKSERHFWATINYIHHNPVKHGYVEQWQDWPYSSASAFIEEVGREEAARIWGEYDISDMGKWDV